MDHDKKQQHGSSSDGKSEDDTQPNVVDLARRQKAKERKLAGQASQKLHSHADKVGKAYLLGANLFQMRVRGDEEEIKKKELEPAIAEKMADVAIEKIFDKLKDAVAEVAEVGESLVSKMTTVFSTIKGNISEKIKLKKELSVMEVADTIASGLIESQVLLEERLHAAIDAISQDKLAAVAMMLFNIREASAGDPADSKEHGKLADGMEDWAITDLLGMPAGDGVAAEEIAVLAYGAFREGVRNHAMSAGEAATDVQRQLSHPDEDKEKMGKAEGQLGAHTKAGIDKDKAMRQRVANTGLSDTPGGGK